MNREIRTAAPEDEADVTALFQASYPQLMAEAYEAETLNRSLPLMTRANPELLASGRFYLVEESGLLLGCGGWSPARPGSGQVEPGLGHIRHFAAHPEYRGLGIGKALLHHCFDEAGNARINRLECYSSLNAADFYQSQGFERVSEIEVTMGPDVKFPSLLMQRSI